MKNVKKLRTITLCSSAAFYKHSLKIKKQLEEMGYLVRIPHTATLMQKTGNYKVQDYKTWYKNPKHYKRKTFLMRKHFDEIVKGDALLVVNFKKKRMDGYIGGNVLMEMGMAFYLRKPIFLLNPISKKSPNYEEVMGVRPVILKDDLSKI